MIYFPPIGWGPTARTPVRTDGDGFALYQRAEGESFVYLSRWSVDAERMLVESRVPRVFISELWTEPNLNALRPCVRHIEELVMQSPAMTDWSLLPEMPALRTLGLHHSSEGVPFASLPQLESCSIASPATLGDVCQAPAFRRLSLEGVPFRDLHMLERMQSLTSLTLDGRHKTSLAGIEVLPLHELAFQLRRLESLAPLRTLPLRRLNVNDGRALRDIEEVGHIATLEALNIEDSSMLRSLEFVAPLSALQQLDIGGTVLSDDVVSLRALSGLSALRELRLSGEKHGLRNLADLESLGALSSLEKIKVHKGPEQIDSIGWVRTLLRLKHFWLGKTRIRDGDVSPLLDLPCIERVAILPTWKNYSHTDETFGAAMRTRLAARS